MKDLIDGSTKSDLRRNFSNMRFLMRELELLLKKEDEITDWSEEGEFGQIANELEACAVNAIAYRANREMSEKYPHIMLSDKSPSASIIQ